MKLRCVQRLLHHNTQEVFSHRKSNFTWREKVKNTDNAVFAGVTFENSFDVETEALKIISMTKL